MKHTDYIHTKDSSSGRVSYKIAEVAEMTGVAPSTLRKMVRRGELNVITAFGPWLVSKVELDRLLGITIRKENPAIN